jgi:hypothetical protein
MSLARRRRSRHGAGATPGDDRNRDLNINKKFTLTVSGLLIMIIPFKLHADEARRRFDGDGFPGMATE